MFLTTTSDELTQAFRDTDYGVAAQVPFVLRIDVASAPLRQLYRQRQCACAAYLTSFNPNSQRVGELRNAEANVELADQLARSELSFIHGGGLGHGGEWPREPSFLVLGLALNVARSLGKKYGQDAIVWCGPDSVPQLILLR